MAVKFSSNSKIAELSTDTIHFKRISPLSWDEISRVANNFINYEKFPKWSKILEANLTTKNYEMYLKESEEHSREIEDLYLYHPIELFIENAGGALATNIDIKIEVKTKKEVKILDIIAFQKYVEDKPTPPIFPFGPWIIGTLLFPNLFNLKPQIQEFDPEEEPDLTFSEIMMIENATNSTSTFSIHVDLLKHGDQMEIPTYWIKIPKKISINEIHMKYQITQNEPVKPKDEVLKLKLK